MTRNFDLHSHTTHSDGLCSPADLIARAAQSGVQSLALTDHDTLDGLAEARAAAQVAGIELIPGVEISVTWAERTLHVIGLGVDPAHRALVQGLALVRSGRVTRAERMAGELSRGGIVGSFEGALALAANRHMVCRSHFARYLVAQGVVKDVKAVFKKYLVPGKPGYVKHHWASLEQAIGWIRASGGVAVLAHPGRYDIGPNVMLSLLQQFRDLGGEALEVVTSNHTAEQVRRFTRLALQFGLHGSRGSDFHGDEGTRVAPGRLPALPAELKPVWDLLGSSPFIPARGH